MTAIITDIEQITPDWLTAVLRTAGALERGRVLSVEANTSRPFGSVVSRLQLTYSEDAPTDAPSRLFLKLANPGEHPQGSEQGKPEVTFYTAVPASDFQQLPLPRCYSAAYSPGGFHILLDDLNGTHASIPHPLPPSSRQCEQVVDTLARLHAYWWNDARLGVSLGQSPDETSVFYGDEQYFPAFANELGEALWPERRQIYERVLAAAPKLLPRLQSGNLTLTHGDSHAWNFLYPVDPAGKAMLVDWETWGVDVGARDLAYMMTLFWFPAHRARDEQRLVRLYHEKLMVYGVMGYSWDECWHDYRHSVIRLLFAPVFWWSVSKNNDFMPELWWPRLERIICAYEDLYCEELLS